MWVLYDYKIFFKINGIKDVADKYVTECLDDDDDDDWNRWVCQGIRGCWNQVDIWSSNRRLSAPAMDLFLFCYFLDSFYICFDNEIRKEGSEREKMSFMEGGRMATSDG